MDGHTRYVIGVDVGNSNTDAVILCGQKVVAATKLPTGDEMTPSIINAINVLLESGCQNAKVTKEVLRNNVSRICIGLTNLENAVVSRDANRLARVAVVRFAGARHVRSRLSATFPKTCAR